MHGTPLYCSIPLYLRPSYSCSQPAEQAQQLRASRTPRPRLVPPASLRLLIFRCPSPPPAAWSFPRRYYFKDNPKEKIKFPITKSLGRSIFYHTGSIAFSAFVIALCDMLRAGAAYLEKQMGPTNNFMVKLAFKVLNCCLACLKKTVKFISYYGLVWVACQGTSFCGGCFKTFFFFLQNPGQVAINALVTKLLKLVSLLSTPLACAVVFYYILDSVMESSHAGYPAAIIGVLAALMTVSCMTVFECTVTTIFVCCFQDKAEFGGRFMSKRLATAFGIKQKKAEASSGGSPPADGDTVQSV